MQASPPTLSDFADQIVNDKLHALTSLGPDGYNELQIELTQFPIIEVLKKDKDTLNELILMCTSFIVAVSKNVQEAAQKPLEYPLLQGEINVSKRV